MEDKNEPEAPAWFLVGCLLFSAAIAGGVVWLIFSQPKYIPPTQREGEDPLDALERELQNRTDYAPSAQPAARK